MRLLYSTVLFLFTSVAAAQTPPAASASTSGQPGPVVPVLMGPGPSPASIDVERPPSFEQPIVQPPPAVNSMQDARDLGLKPIIVPPAIPFSDCQSSSDYRAMGAQRWVALIVGVGLGVGIGFALWRPRKPAGVDEARQAADSET